MDQKWVYFWALFANLDFLNFIACSMVHWLGYIWLIFVSPLLTWIYKDDLTCGRGLVALTTNTWLLILSMNCGKHSLFCIWSLFYICIGNSWLTLIYWFSLNVRWYMSQVQSLQSNRACCIDNTTSLIPNFTAVVYFNCPVDTDRCTVRDAPF